MSNHFDSIKQIVCRRVTQAAPGVYSVEIHFASRKGPVVTHSKQSHQAAVQHFLSAMAISPFVLWESDRVSRREASPL